MDDLKQPFTHGEQVLVGYFSWSIPTTKIQYRASPVPGCSKWRGGGNYFRRPKTTQELSSGYLADDEDYSSLTAAQINHLTKVRILPTAWDDIPRSYPKHPSWKLHREKQYHPLE